MAEAKESVIFTDKAQMRKWSRTMRSQGQTIALVPTMGYLHEGHLSLIKEARNHASLIVVSIYVNPGQFSPSEDLSTYPSDFRGDLSKLMSIPGGVDAVFHPQHLFDSKKGSIFDRDRRSTGSDEVVSCAEMCKMFHETWVRVERLEKRMCGKSRPVLFRGVATVVTKLFNIVEPSVAVFGKKDYLQWRIIERLVQDLDFSIKIIGAEIIRDDNGMAMSSRNVHLSVENKNKALSINRSLFNAKSRAECGQANSKELRELVIRAIHEAGGKIDYAEVVEQETLEGVEEEIRSPVVFCVAAWFGEESFLF